MDDRREHVRRYKMHNPSLAGAMPARRDSGRSAVRLPLGFLILRGLVGALFRLVFRIRVLGREHIPPGPCVICPNHLGWSDGFLMLLFLPAHPRLVMLGLHPRAISAFRAWVVDHLGVMIELDRAHPVEGLRRAREALAAGYTLLIFPEGTYKGGQEGRLQPLHPGAAYLSIASGLPIVPVGLTGTQALWLRRPITIRIGPPLWPQPAAGTRHERADRMTAEVRKALQALLPGDRAGQVMRVRLLRGWLSTLFD
jgi:1-acyl-sn-glycerol-3-phosphate acyltransferase